MASLLKPLCSCPGLFWWLLDMLDAAPSEYRDEREPEIWGNEPEPSDDLDVWPGNYAPLLGDRQEVMSVPGGSEVASSFHHSRKASRAASEEASMTSCHSITHRRLMSVHKIKLATAAVSALRQYDTVAEEEEAERDDHSHRAAALWTKARMHAVTVGKAGKVSSWQPKMIKFLESKQWESLVVWLVLINGVCIAIDTDISDDAWPR
eukprot:3122763-Amphidinium_carterae.2